MDISFDYYKVFYEVARCQNITQAALNLCLTQPTVTKYIHNLEDMLQCKLFNRSQKGVTLTEKGGSCSARSTVPASRWDERKSF